MNSTGPNIDQIRAEYERIAAHTVRTPILRCNAVEDVLGGDCTVYAKLEFLQRTGTFKARGALVTLLQLSDAELANGVTAVSAGNHAIATAYAASIVGTTAKVVMLAAANPSRIAACRSYGAEVVMVEDVHQAFAMAEEIQATEGRHLVHPFEGRAIALGTGGVGLEICEQIEDFDTLIVPIGGGGLIAGIANAVKQLRADVDIIGVEPEGADSMHRSFASGKPESIDKVTSIADSLGAPFAMPYSFDLTRRNVDRLVLINDEQIGRAMGFLFDRCSMAIEPACAATTAALLGPLRDELCGKRVVVLMCGSNIDWATFSEQAIFDHAY